jgi:glutathione S-transferase
MKLYFSPGACSLAPHIALHEAGLAHETEQVDLKTKVTKAGANYRDINPKGSVPALKYDSGPVLTEVAMVLRYIADQAPDKNLAPAVNSAERLRLGEALNYIASELHKSIGILFNPRFDDTAKAVFKDLLKPKFDYVESQLAKHDWFAGAHFSVADIYLFVVMNWTNFMKIDLAPWPKIAAFMQHMAARPGVQAALKAEGLLKA